MFGDENKISSHTDMFNIFHWHRCCDFIQPEVNLSVSNVSEQLEYELK
jgi:hypothetical protein